MKHRFGRGDFYQVTEDGTEDDPTCEARDLFVDVVALDIPEVISTFRAVVAPDLDKLWGDLSSPKQAGMYFNVVTESLGLQVVRKNDYATEELNRAPTLALLAWSQIWNVRENRWFTLRLALRALASFQIRRGLYQDGEPPDEAMAEAVWRLNPATTVPLEAQQAEPLTLPGWDPTAETWGEYRDRIERQVLPAVLREHRAQRAAAFAGTPTKYLHREHLRWLARWQLVGESYAEIAESEGQSDVENLRKAVVRTAELVQLTRRTERLAIT